MQSSNSKLRPRRAALAVVLAVAGCGGAGSADYSVHFAPLVAGQPFSCSRTYANIGTTHTTITPLDFRLYVHDVKLVRAGGDKVPLELTADGKWQAGGIVLLDFEDGSGSCATSSPETNFVVAGRAPAHDDYRGVELTVGVPAEQNHVNAATAAAPLNQPAMWWSWVGGYRYIKLDLKSNGNEGWYFHLGADACTGSAGSSIDCRFPDLALIALANFDAGHARVGLDLATLLADSNLDAQIDGTIDQVPGCMSSTGDPECPPLFSKLGLAFEGQGTAPAQTFFTVMN